MDSEDTKSGVNNSRKLRRKRRKAVKLIQEYAENSSLHGLKYIAEKGRTFVEKIFWVATFLVSISLCLILIKNVWIKWQTSPVIVALSEQLVSVGEVPFPSVTICPQIKAKRSLYNFTHETIEMKKKMESRLASNRTQDDKDDDLLANKYEDIGLVCWVDVPVVPYRKRNYSDATVVQHIIDVAPSIKDIFYGCRWRGDDVACQDIFQSVLTSEGICFTTNSMAASEIFRQQNVHEDYSYLDSSKPSNNWSLKGGYTSNEEDVYPKKGRGNGADTDLRVILREQTTDRDGLCYGINHGYKVYLQHPADMPQSSLYYYAALPEQTSSFAVKFSVTNTSNTLVNYPPKIRQCYFPEERQLKYFRTYTPNNCRLECMSDYTFDSCGCVWFHMPHKDSSTICRQLKKDCVLKALERYAAEESQTDSKVDKCKCLPLCIGIQYDAEVLKTKFDIHSMLNAIKVVYPEWYQNETDEETGMSYTMIELYYKEPRYMSMRRSELFGLTDFLANCGGLLGLFLGFSFLSLVEIFYFCTLRLGCTLRRDTRNYENDVKQN
ncbi:pickpocket protein 28-like [Cydia fagiglandana]|uniref:pickpocket protein 28-like n=1 Tax=Cydia fagiglandana TaxID=1458189 RepID=UPI002FEE600F